MSGKRKLDAIEPAVKAEPYEQGEVVLAYHGDSLHEAKVRAQMWQFRVCCDAFALVVRTVC